LDGNVRGDHEAIATVVVLISRKLSVIFVKAASACSTVACARHSDELDAATGGR
jgi:hypothetical protein